MNYIKYFSQLPIGSLIEFRTEDAKIYYLVFVAIRIFDVEKNIKDAKIYGKVFDLYSKAKNISQSMVKMLSGITDLYKILNTLTIDRSCLEIKDNILLYQSTYVFQLTNFFTSSLPIINFSSLKQKDYPAFIKTGNFLYTDYLHQSLHSVSVEEYNDSFGKSVDTTNDQEIYYYHDEDIFCLSIDHPLN